MVNTINTLTERNKELLNKIEELEKRKNVEIKKYEYSLKSSNLIKRTPEEHSIRENEIMSKIFLEILLRFSKKQFSSSQMTDEEINELLNQPDWREKAQFEVGDHQYKKENEVSESIGYRGCCPWLISAREPIEIIERLNEERNEWISESIRLEKKVKELEKNREWLQKELKEAWSEGDTHIEAMKYAGELGAKQIDNLTKAGEGLLEQLDKEYKKNKTQKEYIEQLETKLYGQEELLRKESEKTTSQKIEIESLQKQASLINNSYLNNKPLPKTPSKFKLLKEKTKIKFKQFQQLVKKAKVKTQEFITRIEVK